MEVITIISSFLSIFLIPCLVGSIVITNVFYKKNKILKDKVINLTKKIEKNEEDSLLNEIDYTGRTGVYIEKSLCFGDRKDGYFSATYDIEVLESTSSKFKIKALSFTVDKSFAKDLKYKNNLMNYIENKWVDKSQVQLVMDLATKRDIKLQKLGI